MNHIFRTLFAMCAMMAAAHLAHGYYDPTPGRWLSMDPIDQPKSTSGYEYCDNDPVNKIDPDGRQAVAGMPYAPSQTYMYGDPYQANLANVGIAMREKAQLQQFGKDGVVIGGVAASAFGGEFILGAYEVGSIGGGTAILSTATLGGAVGATSSVANQLLDNQSINGKKVLLSGTLGAGFGALSGQLGVWSANYAENAAERVLLTESQATFTSSLGRYLDLSNAQMEDAWMQAQLSVAQQTFDTAALTRINWTLDTFGSPFVEESLNDYLSEKLGLNAPEKAIGPIKGCGN